MIWKIAKAVIGPALLWTCLVGSAWIGIGGMSIEGAGASDAAIRQLWRASGVLVAMTFLVSIVVFLIRTKSRHGAD